MKKEHIIILGAVIALVLLYGFMSNSEGYCNCTSREGGRQAICTKSNELAYMSGLTENSDLNALQKAAGGPTWNYPQPGDYNFPGRGDCGSVDPVLPDEI